MQPNYSEQYKKQRQDYQRSRNPFEYGQQVAQRRYSEIMAGLDNQMRQTQQTYGDMYQAARQRAIGQQAMGGPTLSGGMGQQRRDFISTAEMQELGRIGTQRQQAEADLYTQGQAAFSNAQLEGQQATQMELQNRQTELGLVQSRQAILDNKDLTDAQKAEQLAALEGTSGGGGEIKVAPQSFGNKFGDAALTGGTVIGGGLATVATVKGVAAGLGAASMAGLQTGTIIAGAGATAATKVGIGASIKLGLGAAAGIGKIGGAIGGALAAIPGWGWVALAVLAVGSLIYAAVA
jgi:hypothetical protein